MKILFQEFFHMLFLSQLRCYPSIVHLFSAHYGLEIGGPSRFFGRWGHFPIYPIARQIDNCNFSTDTLWKSNIVGGQTYRFNRSRQAGHQYVCDATLLKDIPDQSYDFVLASHVLEHIANPIKALLEWKRVMKPGGALLLVLPEKQGTFDHKRPITSLPHLISDFENNIEEDDLTHVREILEHHDLSKDPGAGNATEFRCRAEQNFANRSLHHHVFDARLIDELVGFVGLKIIALETAAPHHIAAIATHD